MAPTLQPSLHIQPHICLLSLSILIGCFLTYRFINMSAQFNNQFDDFLNECQTKNVGTSRHTLFFVNFIKLINSKLLKFEGAKNQKKSSEIQNVSNNFFNLIKLTPNKQNKELTSHT